MNADFVHPLRSGAHQCLLCRHFCRLRPGERGRCGVRAGQAEAPGLRSLVTDGVAAWHVDPVEKKPLYHYLPGSKTFSFAAPGCNLDCAWCQNSALSRGPAETGRVAMTPVTPEALVQSARTAQCASIAFTYTEPTVFFELMAATADLARIAPPLGTLLVSNGYQSPQCLDALRERITAANIDLKSFRDESYRRWCGARLHGVLDNLKQMKAFGWWLELTTLIVPGINDDEGELRDMARFIRDELGAETPWHISAFYPRRRMRDRPATPLPTLTRTADMGQEEGLWFVYMGNVPPALSTPTRCPGCGTELVRRSAFHAWVRPDFHGSCPQCGRIIPGVWSAS
ncbi:MAG: AmmeMemoRadiSam system radical SAM enzyme [Desulfovibrionaceae bacterium]|nr:AmmeMemoRadiSam system radical SAM enzyme [Desulfovibrionaceae bacterium]